jgi:hypothetical protein
MENTYKWVIGQMLSIPKESEFTDIVIIINYSRQATNGINTVEIAGSYNCPMPEDNFTPYNELTYKQVCEWLDLGVDFVEIDKMLDSQIEDIVNPKVLSLPLPWIK